MEQKTILRFDEVSFSYRPQWRFFPKPKLNLFHSLSFELFDGETLGILGRNGAGKTSLLRLLAGIVAPESGEIYRRPGTRAALLSIGLGFRPDLTGRDNALLAGMLQGASKNATSRLLDQIKSFSELGDAFDDPLKTYSTGMRARLGFSTALMTHVDILLIDEILSVGDAQFRSKATDAIQKRIEGSQTVVFVSHSTTHIQTLCDRVIWIEGGKIRACGSTTKVLEEYDTFIHDID